jgi:hypothetical protein
MMQQLIIDSDFYTNSKQMRDLFVNLEFTKNENLLGGKICPMQFANADMLRQFSNLVGVPQDLDVFEFVPGSGSFILNQEDEPPLSNICIQYPDLTTQWVGVVSLSENTEPHFLKFYKHKRTGWSSIPTDVEQLSNEKIYSYQHIEAFLEYENHNWEEKWEETTRIELKNNQLVLFRPGLFHSYSDVFGDSKETGRLLQFFFLKPKLIEQEALPPQE